MKLDTMWAWRIANQPRQGGKQAVAPPSIVEIDAGVTEGKEKKFARGPRTDATP
jgi:hypothetical protein